MDISHAHQICVLIIRCNHDILFHNAYRLNSQDLCCMYQFRVKHFQLKKKNLNNCVNIYVAISSIAHCLGINGHPLAHKENILRQDEAPVKTYGSR